jgi:hypothetical protein
LLISEEGPHRIGRFGTLCEVRDQCIVKTIDTGSITNDVNIVHTNRGAISYITVGGLNEVRVYRTTDFAQVATFLPAPFLTVFGHRVMVRGSALVWRTLMKWL